MNIRIDIDNVPKLPDGLQWIIWHTDSPHGPPYGGWWNVAIERCDHSDCLAYCIAPATLDEAFEKCMRNYHDAEEVNELHI